MGDKSKAPLYKAGQSYYLGSGTGLPAKIYIDMVYKKSRSKEWMYLVYSEANECKATYLPESILKGRISYHTAPVYKVPEVVQRYEDGYRFCGNYETEDAVNRGKEFATHHNIISILLHPALDLNGNPIDSKHGIWIKWNSIIRDDEIDMTAEVIKIK